MADVEFEPLHGDNEEDSEFMLDKPKRESSAKKYKPKGGQLFQRKASEKKDKTLVIEHSKALASASSPTRSQGHFSHHHHSRQVEGLVGPGDIQFGSSPPHEESMNTISNLSQSTGCIPQTVNQNQPAAWQRQMQLPSKPSQQQNWTQVDNQVPYGFQQLQQRTLSQEKLTLLEKAKMLSSANTHHPGINDGYVIPDDGQRTFHSPLYNATSGVTTPPRLASPTEAGPFSPPNQPVAPPTARRIERSESWGPNTNKDEMHREENWADFSKSFDTSVTLEEEETRRRRESQVSTISEGSEGSYMSEIDDSVWKITEEQRIYYITQFKKLQPNENGVIKGPQARDFFLKSNLPVETLSRIWHLSDLNKDSALDLEEFCIAMHLVVAVKHEVDLPSVLPSTLIPNTAVKTFEASFPENEEVKSKLVLQQQDAEISRDERPNSPQTSDLIKAQNWAKFEERNEVDMKGEANFDGQISEDGMRKERELEISSNAEYASLANGQSADPNLTQANIPKDNDVTMVDGKATRKISFENVSTDRADWQSSQEGSRHHGAQTQNMSQTVTSRPDAVDTGPPPSAKEQQSSKKASIGIARPRGSGATINLIDTLPGQLLPPPDGKKSRKMMQNQQFSAAQDISSPPTSPTSQMSGKFSAGVSETGFVKTEAQDSTQWKAVEETREANPAALEKRVMNSDRAIDATGKLVLPKVTPRKERTTQPDDNLSDDRAGIDKAIVLRRNSSVKRGERPRSYTADSRSSMESLVDGPPVNETNDFGIPPTPPPRKLRTHKRGSSLDLNKLFYTKSLQKIDQLSQDTKEPRIPESSPEKIELERQEEKKEKKVVGDIQIIVRPRPAPQNHTRSISCDSAKTIAPPPKTSEGIVKDPRTQGYRRKPPAPQPTALTRTGRSKSLERTVESLLSENSSAAEKKPRNLRSSRKKRQRMEIQAGIRQLKEKNASISNLNSELQHELKEVIETRTKLEMQLRKMKQLSD